MEAVFFVSAPEAAVGVSSVSDLPGDAAAEPLALDSPFALSGLFEALLGTSSGAMRPVRDATCRSFPLFSFSREVTRAISKLDATAPDAIAQRWLTLAADELGDVDLYDLSVCISDLRDALRASASGERLFVLLEEKAW